MSMSDASHWLDGYNSWLTFVGIMSLTNSFKATAGTNTRNATFKIVHSDLLNITSSVHQQYNNVNNLDSHIKYHTVQCSKITTVYE